MLTEGALRLNRNRSRERKKWCCRGSGIPLSGLLGFVELNPTYDLV